MTFTPWLGGVFNWGDPWLNIPVYVWGLALFWFVFMPIWWFGLKAVKWDPFFKFHGLHYAKKNDSSAVLIVDYAGNADMIAENQAKCIFDYSMDDYEITIPEIPLATIKIMGVIIACIGLASFLISWVIGIFLILIGISAYFVESLVPWLASKLFWYPTQYLKELDWKQAIMLKIGKVNFDCKIAQILQGGEWEQYPVVNCGGIPVEIFYDLDKWCKAKGLQKSKQHVAIQRFCRQWNKDHEKDQIHTYIKFQKYHNLGLIKDEDVPEVTFKQLVTWVRVDSGFPYYPKSDYAGKQRQMAKVQEKKSGEAPMGRLPLYLVIAGVCSLFAILIIREIVKVMTMPKP
jgi:hypothetical protein